MKRKKIFIIFIVIVLVLFGIYACGNLLKNEALAAKPHGNFNGDPSEEKPEVILNTIVFTGKVIPEQEIHIHESANLTRNKIYVSENNSVKQGDLLVDYLGKEVIADKIVILRNDIEGLKETQAVFSNKVLDYKDGLKVASDSTNIYYLKQDLKKAENNLAQTKIDIENKEIELIKLEKSQDDYTIKVQVDGFVYQINEDSSANAMSATSNPFMIIYSDQRVIKIEVNEYELKYMNLDKTVSVEIEGLQKTCQSKIIKVDKVPNNLDTNEDSKYNVEIAIDQEVPYGFNAIVTVDAR